MLRKGYVTGPTGQIHYRTLGKGIPLILSHQSPSSSNMFQAVYSLLAEAGIMAIGVDTPGFGMSDVPNRRPSVGDYATMFAPIMEKLGLDKANFLGHHTGACNVCEFSVQHPQRVVKLILNGPPLYSLEERAQRVDKPKALPIESDGSHLKILWERRCAATPGYSDLDAMQKGVMQSLWAGETAWYGHKAAFEYDMIPSFESITVPTLILTNTGDDLYDIARRAHEMRPDMDYKELDNGTHDIIDEQPQDWTDAVVAYLKN